jgi:hypothetical protein
MARFGQIAKGKRARHPVPFPRGEGPVPLPEVVDGQLRYPSAVDLDTVDLRILTADETADVLADARAHAKKKGVEDPKDGNPIYDLAEMVYTLARACLDHDETEEAPYFDGGAEQIWAEVDRDRIAYLFQCHQTWQDACSPRLRSLQPDELKAHVIALGVADNEIPFVQLSPGMQWICTRTLARLWLSSLERSATSTSPSG